MNAHHEDRTGDTSETEAATIDDTATSDPTNASPSASADAETLVLADAPTEATSPIAPTTPYAPPADAPRYATLAEASADILPPDPVAPAPAPAPVAPATSVGSPRTRWAGVIWGVVLAALATLALMVTLDPSARAATAEWWLSLNGVTGTAYTFLALGGVAVVCAAVGLIGRAQRRRIARRAR